jgi:hypothetical protein
MKDLPVLVLVVGLSGAPWVLGQEVGDGADRRGDAPPTESGGRGDASGAESGGRGDASGAENGGRGDASGAEGEPRGDAPADSPLSYEASEQISEDLSVSFPVDI